MSAVCGLAPRAWEANPPEGAWRVEGSGTLVRWVDPNNQERIGIVTVRHFIDMNGVGGQDVQHDNWYAYFRGCNAPESPTPHLCPCTGDETTRVRVKYFTVAGGEFATPPGADGVLIGEIEPEDLPCIAHITPMTITTPWELNICPGYPAYFAGWGFSTPTSCCSCSADPPVSLHSGDTQIQLITCWGGAGRMALIAGASYCMLGGGCQAAPMLYDSGGAICVEMPDQTLALLAVLVGGTSGFMAAMHDEITPPGINYLCRPCAGRYYPCGDIDGDGDQDIFDRIALDALPPWTVSPYCPGDLNGDGCAGTNADVKSIRDDPDVFEYCDQTCRGDANRDGRVDELDFDMVNLVLALDPDQDDYVPCPCQICGGPIESCPADVDFDGDVDTTDLVLTTGSYECSASAPGCGLSGPLCP